MRWNLAGAIVLGLGWAALYAPAVRWTVRGWSTGDGPLQALIACGLLAFVVRDIRFEPGRQVGPLVVAVCAPVLGALVHRSMPLDVVTAAAAVVSGWGIVGLYVGSARWRRSVPLLLLTLLLLPITGHLDVLLGWPLRKLAASAAAAILGFVSDPVATETVLRVEGGIAHVDLPCAGVRSLWSGAALLLAATVALRRRVDPAWLGIAAIGSMLLVIGNIARVTALVALDHVLGWRLVAEIVHQPLGVVAFVVAGGAALGLLLLRPEAEMIRQRRRPGGEWAPVAVLPALLLAACLGDAPSALPAPTPDLPAHVEAIEPTEAERAFVGEHGGAIAKGRFDGGTVALVSSRSWLAHHVPEMCMEAAGFRVSEDRPAQVDGLPVRVAAAHRDGRTATALWWLQSVDTLTDDHVARIRDGMRSDRPWVLVSVLLDGDVEPSDPSVSALVRGLRASVATTLESP